jgi:hypothetical protein
MTKIATKATAAVAIMKMRKRHKISFLNLAVAVNHSSSSLSNLFNNFGY